MMKSEFSFTAAIKNRISSSAESPLYRNIFVPSFFIFLVLFGTILLGFSFFLEGQIDPAGFALLLLSCAVFLLVYRNALKIDRGSGYSIMHGNVPRIVIVLVLAAASSILVCIRMHDAVADNDLLPVYSLWSAQVESVTEKRYYQEAVVNFHKLDDGGGHGAVYRGMARVSGGMINQGDTVRFSAKPAAVMARSGGITSANRSLLLKGIRYVFYLNGRNVMVMNRGSSFRERARKLLAANCDRLFNRETSAMVKALYFGNQDYIAKTTMNDFKRAGVFHILSAGGLHVGVIAAIPLFLLGIVRFNRRIIMTAAVIAVFLYLYMTDAPVSLLRSCIMFSMFAAQRIAGQEDNIFNTLFISGAVIVLMFPHEIFGLGFQLSYGATLGILLFHGFYRKTLSWLPGLIANPLALTISAQLLVLPVLLVRLNELNLMGLLSNIIVVPLMSLLLVASLAANALSAIPVIADWAGRAVNCIYGLSGIIVQFMSGLDGHYYVSAVGPALIAAFFLLAAPLFPGLRTKRIMSLAIAAAVAVAWLSLSTSGMPRESVTVLRHGAGSLMLVKKGAQLSITGQVPDKGYDDTVMRVITALSPREVTLHITHPDYRNIAGYTFLLKRLPVRRCYLSGDFKVRGYMRRFFDILERDSAVLVILDCGSAARTPSKNVEIQYLTLH